MVMVRKRKHSASEEVNSRTLPSPALTALPMSDPQNALGRAYAASLRERSALLRSGLLVSAALRNSIALDLEALADIAETHPDVFGCALK